MSDPNNPTPPALRRKVSAFASAFNAAVISAEISFEDVLKVKPSMTRPQAEAFLHAHADQIGAAMIEGAVMLLVVLLQGDLDAN
jgi:hypothetical protein